MNIVESLHELEDKLFEEKSEYHDLVGALLCKPESKERIWEMLKDNDVEGILHLLESNEEVVTEDIDRPGPTYDEVFEFLRGYDETGNGGYIDFNQRVEDVAEQFGISKDEAEGFVWQYTLELDDEEEEESDFDVDHAQEWSERHPYGYYNDEDDYGLDDDLDESTEGKTSLNESSSELKAEDYYYLPEYEPDPDADKDIIDTLNAYGYTFMGWADAKEEYFNKLSEDGLEYAAVGQDEKGNVDYLLVINDRVYPIIDEVEHVLNFPHNLNTVYADEIIDWLYEHEQATEDCLNYFGVESLEDIDIEDIKGWISEHDQLADDFERYFEVSLFESVDDTGNGDETPLDEELENDKIFLYKGFPQVHEGESKHFELETTAPNMLKARNNFRYRVCQELFDSVNPYLLSKIYIPFDDISELKINDDELHMIDDEHIEDHIIDDGEQISMFDKEG